MEFRKETFYVDEEDRDRVLFARSFKSCVEFVKHIKQMDKAIKHWDKVFQEERSLGTKRIELIPERNPFDVLNDPLPPSEPMSPWASMSKFPRIELPYIPTEREESTEEEPDYEEEDEDSSDFWERQINNILEDSDVVLD